MDDDYDDDYDDDDDPLPVIPPEDRTMDTPADAVPDGYDGALMEVWANQGGADLNLARATHAAEQIAESVADPEEFGASYDRLPKGAQSAFEEALAIDPKPARLRDGKVNYGPAGAALQAAINNERISPGDGAALRGWLQSLSNDDAQVILNWFGGFHAR